MNQNLSKQTVMAIAWVIVLPMQLHAAEIDFNRDIRPILSNACFKCHGPDEQLREAGLRLDDRAAAIGELDSGMVAIVPGKPDESELLARIMSDDPDVMMPPPSANKTLSDKQKQLLRDWIAAGAEYQPHWSFVPPRKKLEGRTQKAEVSSGQAEGSNQPSEISNLKSQIHNPIDAFIAERLDREGLSLSPEADRHTLVRRVYLDLIGLPMRTKSWSINYSLRPTTANAGRGAGWTWPATRTPTATKKIASARCGCIAIGSSRR
jgi:hypothetical protein